MLTVLISVGLSLLASLFLFSDLFWFHNQSFMWHHDTEIPFENTFNIISFFSQGGVQLFDPFDGFNYAYSHLSSGFYTVANAITAFIYLLFSPFYSEPGQAYHHCFSVVFHAVTMLLRTIGGYCLLNRMRLNRPVMVISLVILNTFLSSTMYFGLLTDNLYSYFPLLAYFIVSYFEHFRARDLAAAFLVFVICVANSPFFALGYFYEPVHFLILSAALIGLIFYRRSIKWHKLGEPMLWIKTAGVLLLAALILLPSGMLSKSLSKDFYVANSGINGTEGRLKSIFNPKKYFSPKSETLIPLKELPFKVVDTTNDWWEKSWIFWGAGIIGLAFFGLVASHRREKYMFGAAMGLIVLSNTALDPSSPLSLAHWINALTNPFAFLLRSYHMPILLMPYLLFVPVALGLQAVWDLSVRIKGHVHWFKSMVLVVGLVLLLKLALTFPEPVRSYAAIVAGLFIGLAVVLIAPLAPKARMVTAAVLMLVIAGIDSNALWKYYVQNQYHGRYFCKDDGRHIKPRIFDDFKQEVPLILEYQDPAMIPWREFVRVFPTQTAPAMHSEQNHYGLFYRYHALERFLLEPNIYAPRPYVYKDLYQDTETIRLLAQDPRSIFLASDVNGGAVQDLGRHLERFELDMRRGKFVTKEGYLQGQWKLPDGFNPFAATGVFTLDQDLMKAAVDGEIYTPVQGALTALRQFDVNNIRKGYLTAALPRGFVVKDKPLLLFYHRSNELLRVRENTLDRMTFDFLASRAGYLKTRIAFNDQWRVTVDGKEVTPVKVDKYFLGVPISQGQHTITWQYGAGSMLRVWIIVSMLLTFLVLAAVLRFSIRSSAF